jgi:glycosyltransferase involved in cell wall biosynthesis
VRVALVHDWLTGMRGGERVLDELAGLFPDADLYTLFHVPGSTSERIERLRIFASPLSRVAGAARHYRKLLPLYPWAIERFQLSGYDLVLSSSHAVAKGVRVDPRTPHVCYCHTPMRYIWDQADAYLGQGLRRAAATPLLLYLRRFDARTSRPDRVQRFVANSRTVAARIRERYGREAGVVYPPVALDRIRPNGRPPEDFFLLVGGFVAYKREDLVLEAFRRLRLRLVVAGDGPQRARRMAQAPPGVEFLGRVSDAELFDLYARARALVFPAEEDFGIAAVEAQAAGRPVIAFGRGGACESVIAQGTAAAPTGLFFAEQSAEALAEAVRAFERLEGEFDPRAIRENALRFAPEHFRAGIQREIAEVLEQAGRP